MKAGFLAAILLAVSVPLFSQENRGTISGSVTDSTGAAIAKAKIIAKETNTGVETTVNSESSGAYTIPFLALGEYSISAESPGFKKFTQTGITLSAGMHPVVDIRLEVGAITESVEVHEDAPILETANPTVGQVITGEEVENFPVNGRTPMMLANLAMGVISTYEPGPVRPFDNGAPNSISIGGAPSARNEVLLNGAPNAGFSNQMAYSPPQDAVTEVRTNTFQMDASYGHTMGGTVNLITKSGTNSLHGVAYIFNQTSALDANSFFGNAKGVGRPSYHQNQYGVNGGGPIFLPKVFDGRNKVFWYFAWEGMRDSDPATSPLETGNPENFTTVPTPAERQGDFSSLLTVNQRNPADKNNYTIYDPTTGVMAGTLVSRTPFPGNIIPQNRLNPIALKYMQYYPQPNTPGQANGLQNFVTNAIDSDGYDNELGRLDINATPRNRFSIDARHNFRNQNKNDYFGNPATGNFLYRINQGFGLDYIGTITPTTVAEVRGNWTRYEEHHFSPADSVDPASLGFPSYINANAKFPMLPYVVVGSTSISAGARAGFEPMGYNGDGTNYSDSYQIFADVVKIRGNHTMKVGTDGRMYRWSAYTFGNPSGSYTFTGNWTNSPAVSNTTVFGQDMAAFLLGLPNSGSFDMNTQSTVQGKYLAFFVNDDWRIRPNLTINLGLRWEHDFPEVERYNRTLDGFAPTAVNSISAAAAAAYALHPVAQIPVSQFTALGGPTFASANNRNVYDTKSAIFSPRFGFAWTPRALGNKTVIRGGFGILVDPLQLPAPYQPGFSQQTQMTVTTDNYLTPAATLSNPFPNGFVLPAGSSKGASTNLGQQISIFNPSVLNPYTVRWQLSIQRQLPFNMVLEVAYIGSHAMHLPITRQLDYIPRQFLSTSLARDTANNTLLSGTVTNPFKGLLPNTSSLNGSTVALRQLLIPFPQYPVPGTPAATSNGIVEAYTNSGASYFQSLNVRLQKRFTNGLTLMNNFIWNKLIDRLAFINDSDPLPEKRISSDSRPLRNVLASTYQLPIGRGRRLNLQNRVVDFLVGGWGISGILTLQSGPVLGWGNYIYYGGPINLNTHQPNGLAFDTTQFNTIAAQQLVDNIRYFDQQFNNLRRDATKQLDATFSKSFKLNEKRYFQFRVEAFNVTNRVTFGGPQTNPTNSAFGTISSQANTPRRIESGLRLVW
ncbi:MAG: carboxypeptidase regulatory-like domain-containing protein [Acidobacteria bacterium]|nr:carboxypeptidase regulatory-like domain-containing protein [Acidobacteriota bacterium]